MNVVFRHNNKTYSISKCIKQVQKNSRQLFNEFKKGTFELISDEMFIYIAEKIIGNQGIIALENKNEKITLSAVVDYLMEQITIPLHSREKNIKDSPYPVLLKKIKKFEQIATDISRKVKKEIIMKTESMPEISWIYYLEKLISAGQSLLGEIERLMTDKIEDVTLLSYKKRIKKIMKILVKEYESESAQLSVQEWSLLQVKPISQRIRKIRNSMMRHLERIDSYIIPVEGIKKWR